MKHRATDQFWRRYHGLSPGVRRRADKAFSLMKVNSGHPSLQFKKVGTFWSARVDRAHRAIAVEDSEDFIWVWIGSHDAYERILKDRSL